jgi:ATP-dependent RNA helicase DeaD
MPKEILQHLRKVRVAGRMLGIEAARGDAGGSPAAPGPRAKARKGAAGKRPPKRPGKRGPKPRGRGPGAPRDG